MISVLVYGCVESAERIAKVLESEMLVEVRKLVIEGSFSDLSTAEIMKRTEGDLSKVIGRYDLIILADPLDVMASGAELKRKYPEQKFVCYGQGLERVVQKLKTIYILTSQKIRRLEVYQRMKARCQEMKIVELDSVGWKEMMEKKWINKEELMKKIKSVQGAPIIVFHPELSLVRMKEIIDWRGDVVDVERALLKTVQRELGLKNWR